MACRMVFPKSLPKESFCFQCNPMAPTSKWWGRWRKLYQERESMAASLALCARRSLILSYLVVINYRPWFCSILCQTSRNSNGGADRGSLHSLPLPIRACFHTAGEFNDEELALKPKCLGSNPRSITETVEFGVNHLFSVQFSLFFSICTNGGTSTYLSELLWG